jgi:hypothetical protein
MLKRSRELTLILAVGFAIAAACSDENTTPNMSVSDGGASAFAGSGSGGEPHDGGSGGDVGAAPNGGENYGGAGTVPICAYPLGDRTATCGECSEEVGAPNSYVVDDFDGPPSEGTSCYVAQASNSGTIDCLPADHPDVHELVQSYVWDSGPSVDFVIESADSVPIPVECEDFLKCCSEIDPDADAAGPEICNDRVDTAEEATASTCAVANYEPFGSGGGSTMGCGPGSGGTGSGGSGGGGAGGDDGTSGGSSAGGGGGASAEESTLFGLCCYTTCVHTHFN